MTLIRTLAGAALAAAALASLSACASAPPAGALASADCFSTVNWRGWSSPVDDVIYLRVGVNDIYRIDLVPGSGRNLDSGGQFLISESVGSNRVCTANDLQLAIADPVGFRTPLFPRTITKLTPEEVAALPTTQRP